MKTKMLTALMLAIFAGNLFGAVSDPPAVSVSDPPAAKIDTAPAPTPKAAAEPAAGYVSPAAATVAVRVPTGNGATDCGTGSVVWSEAGKSFIVTNKHVVVGKRSPDGMTVTVNATGKTYPARFVDWSAEGDVALLEVDSELPAVVIGWNPSIGERTTHYGNRTGPQVGTVRGFEETATSGNGTHPWAGWIMRGTHVGASGDSGAGVFNDRGELVAVLWGGHSGDAHAAPVYVVRRLLSRVAGRTFPRLAARLAADPPAVVVTVPQTAPAAAPKAAPGVAGAALPFTPGTTAHTAGTLPPARGPNAAPAPSGVVTYTLAPPVGAAGITSGCAGGNCPAPARTARGLFRR